MKKKSAFIVPLVSKHHSWHHSSYHFCPLAQLLTPYSSLQVLWAMITLSRHRQPSMPWMDSRSAWSDSRSSWNGPRTPISLISSSGSERQRDRDSRNWKELQNVYVLAAWWVTCHMSRVTCHMPHVTRHMSRVTRHISRATCHACCTCKHFELTPVHAAHDVFQIGNHLSKYLGSPIKYHLFLY